MMIDILKMRKVCVKLVPKTFTDKQKDRRVKKMCQEFLDFVSVMI